MVTLYLVRQKNTRISNKMNKFMYLKALVRPWSYSFGRLVFFLFQICFSLASIIIICAKRKHAHNEYGGCWWWWCTKSQKLHAEKRKLVEL